MEATIPRNGANVYSKPAGTTAVSGTTIESSKYNQTIDDLVNDANLARPIVAGGTGATTAGDARANLSVQEESDGLTSIAALGTAADKMLYTTAEDTYAEADLTSFARSILDDADAASARATLGASQSPLDEDDFASNSAARPPTQQSSKAYVDNKVAALPFTKQYISSGQPVTSGGTLTLAHGFSELPKFVQLRLRFDTAALGYDIGHQVIAPDHFCADGSRNQGVSVRINTSDVIVYFGSHSSVFRLLDTTGARQDVSNGDVRLIVSAWA